MDRARLLTWAAIGVVALSFVATAALYPQLPARVPTHWDLHGNVDGTAPKPIGAWIAPLISIAALALLVWLPRLDPLRANYATFLVAYRGFALALMLFFAWIQTIVLAASLGRSLPPNVAIGVALGALMIAVSALLRRAAPTWFIGIRTPWTLSDPEVWRATHAIAARLFLAAGGIAILAALLPPIGSFAVAIGAIAIASLASVAYSFFAYRARHPRAPQA